MTLYLQEINRLTPLEIEKLRYSHTETGSISINRPKRESKKKFQSNPAADKALRRTSMVLVEQLNLFETTLHSHKINGLTPLEMEKLIYN